MKTKNLFPLIVLAFLASLFTVNDVRAQSDNRGTDFWVCFPQNAKQEQIGTSVNFRLYITGDKATKGTVIVPGKLTIPFGISAGEVKGIDIDTSMQILTSDVISHAAVHVHTDEPVAVYGLSNRKASTDTYVAYPTNVLGNSYRAMCYAPLSGTEDAFTSQITFIATDDNTNINIFPTANTKGGKLAGQPFGITLQRGEVYQMQGTTHGDGRSDLTGTLVKSTKPIAFFTGHTCAQVPSRVNFCDQLVEEEAPINTWGKQFFVSKMLGKDFYVVRVVANEDDTKIFFNEKYVKTLAAGEFYEDKHVGDNVLVTSDKPVLVGQFATSSDADSVKVGDPFLMLIAPTEQFLSSYTFATPIKGGSPVINYRERYAQKYKDSVIAHIWIKVGDHDSMFTKIVPKKKRHSDSIDTVVEYFPNVSLDYSNIPEPPTSSPVSGWHHYINIVVPLGGVSSLRLDGNPISTNNFSHIGISRFAIIQLEIGFGSHTMTCDRPFGLYSYGFGVAGDAYDSYGNCAGQRVARIERMPDTSKPTLEIAQDEGSDQIKLIARDDRLDDLGLGVIMVTDSSNVASPIAYQSFDVGAPEFKFDIKSPSNTHSVYIKVQDFAKNESYWMLEASNPNSSQAAKYSLSQLQKVSDSQHEVYPLEIYPSPAKFGQPVNINFTNALPEFIAVQVIDEGGNIVTDLQKKTLTGSGKHSLVFHSDKFLTGSFFLRFTAYSSGGQETYKQDAHFIVIH